MLKQVTEAFKYFFIFAEVYLEHASVLYNYITASFARAVAVHQTPVVQ